MKFVLACWGSRGDIEPVAVVGRELGSRRCRTEPRRRPRAGAPRARRVHGRPARPGRLHGGGRGCGGRLRTGGAVHPGRASRVLDVLLQPPLEDPGSGQVAPRNFGAPAAGLAGDEHDAGVAGGRGRPDIHRHQFRGRRRQRRGVLRHSVGHAALLSAAAQRPDPGIPAGANGPRGSGGVLVGVVACDEEGRGRPAPRTGPTEGNRIRAAADHRTRIAGNPGLRRGMFPRAGRRMGGI